jgi:hypothetical protein
MRRPTRSPFHRPAMQTLERLHAELGGQILENKEEAQRLAGQMLHVEAVIKMLDPTYRPRSRLRASALLPFTSLQNTAMAAR